MVPCELQKFHLCYAEFVDMFHFTISPQSTLAHSQREKQILLAMLFSTSKGEISKSKSKSLDFAIAFPLGGGTCSTLALLQFEKIVLKVIFCLDCSILVLI